MVRRGPAIRYRLAQCDDARDRDEKGASFSARRAAEGLRRARLRLLHALPQPQGPRARGKPAGDAAFLLDGTGAPGGHRRPRCARVGGGIRRVFRKPAPGEPALGDRLAAERTRGEPGGARNADGGGVQALSRLAAPPGALGRLPSRSGTIRILAGPQGPPARPAVLPQGRRRLENRTAGALKGHQPYRWEGDGLEAPPGPEETETCSISARLRAAF